MEEKKIIKFLKGTASPQDEYEVREWLMLPGSRKEFDALIENYWKKASPSTSDEVDYDRMLRDIHKRMRDPSQDIRADKSVFIYKSLRVAASLFLFMFCSYVLFESFSNRNTRTSDQVQRTITTKTTGPGEKLTLVMADKTRIIVNSGSEISFYSDYGVSDRVINIKGEAYFDVVSDSSKPFKVITEEVTTTALGTEFNVYSRNNDYRIALVEGKVAVDKVGNQVELTPGLMALWSPKGKASDDFSVGSFEAERVTAWKEGNLIFERKPFGDVLHDLSEWYSVDIRVDESIDVNKKVIGTFQNKNLKDILTGLSFSLDFSFTIDNNRVHIKKTAL
ncbi:FecR family protein [Algoriphagus sp. Y33]|uniref:FecR family protein n=1 Tax=Algoriphagus sp. Y33 TaxID=2772483 RepID=UPI00177B51E1|nr:FecR domain-containing protein [Algoriphagus sp. Y33]